MVVGSGPVKNHELIRQSVNFFRGMARKFEVYFLSDIFRMIKEGQGRGKKKGGSLGGGEELMRYLTKTFVRCSCSLFICL